MIDITKMAHRGDRSGEKESRAQESVQWLNHD